MLAGFLTDAAVPPDALFETWGEIEYACYPDRQGYITVARRVPGVTGWEEQRSRHRAAKRDMRFAIDGNGRLHIVFGPEGSPLRYVFSLEQGGLELSRTAPMTGDREKSVRQSTLCPQDDGGLIFIYNSGTKMIPDITIDWFSLYDGEWARLHDSLVDHTQIRGSKWKADTDKTGMIRLTWSKVIGEEHEAVSTDGGLTWQTPEGEWLELPIR